MNATEFYNEKIHPLREANKPIPDSLYVEFDQKLRGLVRYMSRDFPLSLQERDEIVTDACSLILLRLHKDSMSRNVGEYLNRYIHKTLHGLWVELVNHRVKNCGSLMARDWLDEMGDPIGKPEPISPDVYLEDKEESEYYLKTVAKVAKQIAHGRQRIALLGFYCYRYDLDINLLPLNPWDKERVLLVRNTFEYYLTLKRPSWLTTQI